MKVIIINPWAKTVAEGELTTVARRDRFEEIKRLIGVCGGRPPPDYLDGVRMFNGDRIWVDDTGYKKLGLRNFFLKGYPYSIVGVGILTGQDEEGYVAEPHFTVDQVLQMVVWTGLDTTGDVHPPTTKGNVTTMGQPILKPAEPPANDDATIDEDLARDADQDDEEGDEE